jgi:glucans biosynthesis protein
VKGEKRTYFAWRFAVDFAGGDLSMLGKNVKVEPVITASHGKIEVPSVHRLDMVQGYRVTFDLKPTDDSVTPVNLRLYLRADGQPLTETWLYQWTRDGL